jgi:excisionase family DNA binding protein
MNDDSSIQKSAREEFLTVRQLASILQVSETTVRRLAHKGRIPSVRLTPRILRFHLQAVRDALGGTSHARSRRAAASVDTTIENSQLSFSDLL